MIFLKKKKISGLVTLPVCKKTLKKNGFNFFGQTEYLSNLVTKRRKKKNKEIMILSTTKPTDNGSNLIVGLLTTHVPLKNCLNYITKQVIEDKVILFHQTLRKLWKIDKPKIAIASINPHAGEGGLIGREEITLIKPVLKRLDKKFNITGPLSSDSCFSKDIRKNFNGILCFYHDQGLIPFKTLSFGQGVNFTAGLSAVRTSPDHGTAFGIAGTGQANPNSFRKAVQTAIEVVKRRKVSI